MTTQTPSLVVGWDRTAASRCALDVATDLATRLGAHLHVVHVVDLRDYPVDPDSADWEQAGQSQLDNERDEVTAHLSAWDGDWTYHLERGDPVRALADVGTRHGALMIVVGTRGSGIGPALQRLLTGTRSVSHTLENGRIPVLVVAQAP